MTMRQLRQLELRLSNLGEWLPFRRPQDLAVFVDGLTCMARAKHEKADPSSYRRSARA